MKKSRLSFIIIVLSEHPDNIVISKHKRKCLTPINLLYVTRVEKSIPNEITNVRLTLVKGGIIAGRALRPYTRKYTFDNVKEYWPLISANSFKNKKYH